MGRACAITLNAYLRLTCKTKKKTSGKTYTKSVNTASQLLYVENNRFSIIVT